MSNLVKYGDFSLEDADKELEELSKLGGDKEYMKLPVGRNVVRVLPPRPGEKVLKRVMEHFIRVAGANRPVIFSCPQARQDRKDRCPACERAARLRASGNPQDREAAYDMSAKLRVYLNVIDRKNPGAGPQILPVGKQIYEQLLTIRKDEDAGGNYIDPENGFDIVIERVGTGKNDTTYTVNPSRKTTPLHTDSEVASSWIENQANLERFDRVRTYDDLMKSLGGGSGGGGGPRTAPRAQPAKADAEYIPPKAKAGKTADADLDGVHGDDDVGF